MVSTSYADIFATFALACRMTPDYARKPAGSGLSCPLERLRQLHTVDCLALGVAHVMNHDRTPITAGRTAAALLRFEVGELVWLRVTGVSRFRDQSTALRQFGRGFPERRHRGTRRPWEDDPRRRHAAPVGRLDASR